MQTHQNFWKKNIILYQESKVLMHEVQYNKYSLM